MQPEFYAEYAQAQEGHWWFGGRRRILEAVLGAVVRPRPEAVLAEIGSGTGAMAPVLGRYGWLVGVDASWEAGRHARRMLPRFVVGRMEALPLANRSCDVVFACDVLEHVDDDAAALGELRRVCKPEGALVLTAPAFGFLWSGHDEINHHRRRYTGGRLRALLRDGGWRITKLTYFNTLLFAPIAGIRLCGRLGRGPRPAASALAWRLPGPLNRGLEAVFASERHWLARWDLPFGVSVLCVARPA